MADLTDILQYCDEHDLSLWTRERFDALGVILGALIIFNEMVAGMATKREFATMKDAAEQNLILIPEALASIGLDVIIKDRDLTLLGDTGDPPIRH